MSMCVYHCRRKGLRTKIHLSKKSPYHSTGSANDSKTRTADEILDRVSPHSPFQENCLILSPCFHRWTRTWRPGHTPWRLHFPSPTISEEGRGLCVLPSSCCLCMTSCGFQHLVLNLPIKASSYSLTFLPDWNCPEKWYLRDWCEVSPEPITHCSSPSQESCFRKQTLDETCDHFSLDSGRKVYRRN